MLWILEYFNAFYWVFIQLSSKNEKNRKISIKKIDRNIECENIGYRNSERIHDEWGWRQTIVFFVRYFLHLTFWFSVFFTFDSYFWYISFPQNSNKSKSFKFNYFRDFWQDLYDQVAPCTLKKIGLLPNLYPGEEHFRFRTGLPNLKRFSGSRPNLFLVR